MKAAVDVGGLDALLADTSSKQKRIDFYAEATFEGHAETLQYMEMKGFPPAKEDDPETHRAVKSAVFRAGRRGLKSEGLPPLAVRRFLDAASNDPFPPEAVPPTAPAGGGLSPASSVKAP